MRKYAENRIWELRKRRHMTQSAVANAIGISQQAYSQCERDIVGAKGYILDELADLFNVTTDYLLGRTDVKRDIQVQMKMDADFDEYYEWVECIKCIEEKDRELLWLIVQKMRENSSVVHEQKTD